MMDIIKNISNKNKKGRFIHQTRKYLIIAILLIFSLNSFGQNNADSLKSDSISNIPRIKLNTKDSVAGYIPVDELVAGNDSLETNSHKKNPRRASLFSAILPGLGQAYNGNYWKIPIIYSIAAGLYFMGEENNNRYVKLKRAYKYYDDGYKEPGINKNFTKENIKEYKDYYKRNRDLYIILGVAAWLLNIMDACVDAHLMDYDISDDLSLKIQPDINLYQAYQKNTINSGFGIKFVLNLHK